MRWRVVRDGPRWRILDEATGELDGRIAYKTRASADARVKRMVGRSAEQRITQWRTWVTWWAEQGGATADQLRQALDVDEEPVRVEADRRARRRQFDKRDRRSDADRGTGAIREEPARRV